MTLDNLSYEAISKKAEELYPFDAEETCKDEFTRNLRNEIIVLIRNAFVEGSKYAMTEIHKYVTTMNNEE